MESLNMGLWSIVPPILTIALALIFKDVLFALLIGILSGTLIVCHGSPVPAITTLTDKIASSLNDGWNIRILLFCALLGGFVAILNKTGAAKAFGSWMVSKIKSRKAALFCTFLFGIVIFIDDYFNSLSIGTAMRPICDEHKVSRAKLSYILDSTAAPICIIAPVSSWVVTVMSLLRKAEGFDSLNVSEFEFFCRLIPYNLYVILTLLMVVCVCLFNLDFGPMARSEERALSGKGLFDEETYGKNSVENIPDTGSKARACDMFFPLLFLIVTAILAFPATTWYLASKQAENPVPFYQGMTEGSVLQAFRDTDASYALFYAIIVTMIFSYIYFLSRRLISLREFGDAVISGIRSMVPALVILTLAWTIGGVIKSSPAEGGVGLANYLSHLATASEFPLWLLPLVVFILGCLIAFSTGTSWGTMTIMIPITLPIVIGLCKAHGADDITLLNASLVSISATVGGAVFGDHTAPMSDTTILSATGAGCPCLEHVATQLPYALFCAICAGIGYIAAGLMVSYVSGNTLALFGGILISLLVFVCGIRLLPVIFGKKAKMIAQDTHTNLV